MPFYFQNINNEIKEPIFEKKKKCILTYLYDSEIVMLLDWIFSNHRKVLVALIVPFTRKYMKKFTMFCGI